MTDHPQLIAEQVSHVIDLLKAENRLLTHRVEQLERTVSDQETRLRANTEGVTQFKVWSGILSGGSIITAILALLKSFTGG